MNCIQRSVAGYPPASVIPRQASVRRLTRAVVLLTVSCSLVLASCAGAARPTPTRSSRSATLIENKLTAAERLAIFDTAWQTVNDKYWDPTFGGKDWQAIGDEYRQKLATVKDDATFWLQVLNPMLFELGVSHLVALPADLIDLRGNPGGQFPVRKAIASQLVGEPKLFIRYQLRDRMEEAYLEAVPNAYPGILVILVDELSASSSEKFAGSLQALGRATIIGSQTPGRCLVMNIAPLPKGGMLTYPYGQSQTPDGRVLEDNGVVPDIEVALDREELLQGVDAQLEAAIQYLAGQMR